MKRLLQMCVLCAFAALEFQASAMPLGARTLLMGHFIAQRWIPTVPEDAKPEEIAAALSGVADTSLASSITNAAEYASYREWALGVKGPDGISTAGAQAVKESSHAWSSYLLGAEALLENEPEVEFGAIEVGTAEGGGSQGSAGTVATVSVTVKDGGRAVQVDAEKVAGMFEATGDLDDWNGAAKLPVNVEVVGDGSQGTANSTMRFKVTAGDGAAERTFMRIRR